MILAIGWWSIFMFPLKAMHDYAMLTLSRHSISAVTHSHVCKVIAASPLTLRGIMVAIPEMSLRLSHCM